MTVIGSHKKVHGLRFGLYNECSHSEESFFVVCQSDMDRLRYLTIGRTDALKQSMLTKLLKRVDLTTISQRVRKMKADMKQPIIHLETFLQVYM